MTQLDEHEPETTPSSAAPARPTAIPPKGTEAYTEYMRELGSRGGKRSAQTRGESSSTIDPSLDDSLDSEDPALTIRMMMRVQRATALGKGKPRPSAQQQTAAAKAWGELRDQLQRITHESDSAAFDLAQLTDRLDVLRVVVGLEEEGLERLRAWCREEEERA